jgi:hypothetical protein
MSIRKSRDESRQRKGPFGDDTDLSSRRKRVARLVGRLLARQWMRQQHSVEKENRARIDTTELT